MRLSDSSSAIITLPAPQTRGKVSVEEAIARRRSGREFRSQTLSLSQLSQLLWAAQGITEPPLRAAPSAGATYPLEVFVVSGAPGVEGLEAGLYYYDVAAHGLRRMKKGDLRAALSGVALGQPCISQAPVSMVVGAVYERTAEYYGQRAERYVAMEAGHVGQNVHLEAVVLGLGTVMVGAFSDGGVAKVLELEKSVRPLYIMPLGWLAS